MINLAHVHWRQHTNNCCHVRMGFPHLTLLLLITGSTRARSRKCIVGTTPKSLPDWTLLLRHFLPSFSSFLRLVSFSLWSCTHTQTRTRLYSFALIYSAFLLLTFFFLSSRSITITIFFSFHHFFYTLFLLRHWFMLFFFFTFPFSSLEHFLLLEMDRTNTFTGRLLEVSFNPRKRVYPSTRFFGFRFLLCIFYLRFSNFSTL